jgi:phosphohistidine swiveling domain-containing protein
MAGKSLDKLKDEFKEKMLAKKKGMTQLQKEQDAAFTKLVLDQLDKKKPKLLSGSDDPPKIGSSAIETAYKEIKEYIEKHPAPTLVKPKAHTPFSDAITQMSDIVIGIDPGSNEQSVMGVKVLKNKYVPPGTAYIIGGNTVVMAENLGKPEKPATMSASPKKGINVKDLPIYRFGPKNEGNASMKGVLGGKGANLAEMAAMGLPVPAGWTIPCEASVAFLQGDAKYQQGFLEGLKARIMEGDQYLYECFGYHPLVSVRSGAPVSMPGMMDTILNVGINDENLEEWKQRLGERAALDSYRRFLQMYGATALGMDPAVFEDALEDIKAAAKVTSDGELDASFLVRLIKRYKDLYTAFNKAVPKTRQDAILGAIEAVFHSWNSQRAQSFRADNNIPFSMGTAVNVQAMVFGNMNDKSCSGVAFTRDKSNGINTPSGDFLVNAQGEEVVAGTRDTEPLHNMQKWNVKLFNELIGYMGGLEKHYKDMQDIEFTVQDGKLYILQTRDARRSALAAFVAAHDMVKEGLISKEEALARIKRDQLLTLMRPSIDPAFKGQPIGKGLPVGGTVVTGMACFDSASAMSCKASGKPALLIRKETDPNDYDGIKSSVGVLTATGGPTAHAAVVCNGLDKPCVVGCTELKVTPLGAKLNGNVIKAGDWVSIDGTSGNIWLGEVPVKEPQVTKEVLEVARWYAKSPKAFRVTAASVAELGVGLMNAPGWAEVIYVDTCSLKDAEKLSIAGSFVEADELQGKTVVIDLSGPDGSYGKCDKAVNRMFGLESGAQDNSDVKVQELLLWSDPAAARTVVKVPKSCTLADQLRWKGFKVIGPVKTVADLLNSDGAVTIDDDTVMKVFGSKEALLFVQDAMGKAGKAPSKPVPEPEYWWEPLMREGAE